MDGLVDFRTEKRPDKNVKVDGALWCSDAPHARTGLEG